MAKTKTYTALVVDRSGSMRTNREEAEGGVRGFIQELNMRLPDSKPLVSLYQFDVQFERLWGPVKVSEAVEYSLEPRGMTALFDAVGAAIEDTKRLIDEMPQKDKPEKVAVVIMTDGEENSSREYTFETVQKLISERMAEGWEFVFLAGTLKAQQFAQASGIRNNITFDPAKRGQTRSVYAAAASATMDWYDGNTENITTPETVTREGTEASGS